MPPPPELADRLGQIGVVEVFREVEAEHLAQPDGHIGIAGKVVVDLQGVVQCTQPSQRGADQSRFQRKDLIGPGGEPVGQNHLFAQPVQKPLDAVGKPGQGNRPAGQLVFHLGVQHDGTGHQLGEKAHIQSHPEPAFLHGGLAPVKVDDIAHGLKGVEADAQRQGNVPHRQQLPARQCSQRIGGEGVIFKVAQQPQVGGHRADEGRFAGGGGAKPAQTQPAQII